MSPDDRDAGYLWDMLDAARAVEDLISRELTEDL